VFAASPSSVLSEPVATAKMSPTMNRYSIAVDAHRHA
jgi:hypothetical protein